jgi:gliding motility-associated-like protein
VNFLCEGPGAAFHFYFQYQDAGNYYGLTCSPETSQMTLVAVAGGVEEILSAAPAALFAGQWHELTVERGCDDQIAILLDGEEEIAVSDAALLASGSVALGAAEEMVYADELRFDAFQPQVQIQGETAFCIDPAVLEASGAFAQYEWSTGSKSNRVEILEPGIVWLEVTDQNGCTARDTVEVLSLCPTQFYAPNIFSPNYDGVNDEFRIYPRSQPLRFELSVFNRWGELVFRADQADMGWDGMYKGTPAPADVYIWLADMDGFTLTGTLNLLR